MGGGEGVWREEDKPPCRHFGVAVVIWSTYKLSTMLRRHSWSNGSSFRPWYIDIVSSSRKYMVSFAQVEPDSQMSTTAWLSQ